MVELEGECNNWEADILTNRLMVPLDGIYITLTSRHDTLEEYCDLSYFEPLSRKREDVRKVLEKLGYKFNFTNYTYHWPRIGGPEYWDFELISPSGDKVCELKKSPPWYISEYAIGEVINYMLFGNERRWFHDR